MDFYLHTWTYEQYITLYLEIINTEPRCGCWFADIIKEYADEFEFVYLGSDIFVKSVGKTGRITDIDYDTVSVNFYVDFPDTGVDGVYCLYEII
ncbi:hypothetical protein [Escherichia phage BF17]|nr:hypothetical protein [Escherichia phage BF17]